jgi:hypothetical protein
MANPTVPFSWQMPEPTDLVTNLPADFEVFGQAVATDLQYLLGGTTGQVLAKASGTDLDFVWSADAAGMTNPMTTTGDVIYSSSGSTPARLGIGTANQVLAVNSGGTAPEWQTSSSGGMTLISTTSLTGSSITLSSIPSTYKDLRLDVRNFYSSTDGGALLIRLNGDSGSNRYKTFQTAPSTTNSSWPGNALSISEGQDNAVADGLIVNKLYDYANSTTYKMVETRTITVNEDTPANLNFTSYMGFYNQTDAISSIVIYTNGTAFSGGTALLYGVK